MDAKRKRRAELKAAIHGSKNEYKFENAEAEAEALETIIDAQKEIEECSVNFRWQKEQLELVKKAAARVGVPYQTYIKLCVFRQAQADLAAADKRASHTEFAEIWKAIEKLSNAIDTRKKPIA